MTKDNDPLSSIDWTKVAFPSDRLALGEVRKALGGSISETTAMIAEILHVETKVACHAMVRDLSDTLEGRRVGDVLLGTETLELGELYANIGLAHGKHEAEQLVERLITSARAHTPPKSERGRSY